MQFVSHIPADGKHVFIGVGAGDGTVEVPCTLSLFSAAALLRAANISVSLCIEAGNCHVDDMRNSIVTSFLETDADELIFIDEDVGFEPVDLLRLINHDRDVVGGVYPKKEDEENFPVYTDPGIELWADKDGLVEVQGLPTGFLKIKRHVIETLKSKAVCYIGSDKREYHVLFERTVTDGRRWSGDYAFCRKWLAHGGKLYTDPYMTFSHTGRKTWTGDLGTFWRRKHGVEAREKANALVREVEKLKAGVPDFDALHKAWGNEGWTASPDLLRAFWDNCEGNVLECGSGLSTLVLAANCKVTVLEHDPMWASHIAGMLEQFGLEAEILCKPLKGGWYDFPGGEYDCMVIDGPPRDISDRSVALARVNAPLIVWDDYVDGLDGAEVFEGDKTFAIWRERVKHEL